MKDKERYKSEMVVYREKQKAVICDAVPIRQQQQEEEKEKVLPVEEKKVDMLPENGEGSSTRTESEPSTDADAGVESANRESLTDSDGFELRRRDNAEEVSGPPQGVF